MKLYDWAQRWGVPAAALIELAYLPYLPDDAIVPAGTSEANVQSRVRLEGAKKGVTLFRNNVGAGKVLHDDGSSSFLRWGLANDSKALNTSVKSGDLIGIKRVLIQPEHVGTIVGQFVSRECKRTGWRYTLGDEDAAAQMRWAAFVNAQGGDAAIVQSEGSL